jgi:hypothetical protein
MLEEILVEKLALSAWRHRRLIITETAEIRNATESLGWEAERQQAENGLIQGIANPAILERCLKLLRELNAGIEEHGFDAESDLTILTKLYVEPTSAESERTLFDSYDSWASQAEVSEEERQEHGCATPEECKKNFLEELADEIERLERYKKERAPMESEKMKLAALRQRVPLTPQFDHLLKYEASLERNFDRTLGQLERLQRMRLGQLILPKLEVHHSVSEE